MKERVYPKWINVRVLTGGLRCVSAKPNTSNKERNGGYHANSLENKKHYFFQKVNTTQVDS